MEFVPFQFEQQATAFHRLWLDVLALTNSVLAMIGSHIGICRACVPVS